MKVAVIGSRSFTDYDRLEETLAMYQITEIISGGANGADKLAERYADTWKIPITIFRPDWSRGLSAGKERNTDIVSNADIIIAFWNGTSPGTKDSIQKAKRMNKQVRVELF